MLKYVKNETYTYDVIVERSDLLIGQLIKIEDGFYYFSPTKDGGLWSDYTLIEIGIKLKELNDPLISVIDRWKLLNN